MTMMEECGNKENDDNNVNETFSSTNTINETKETFLDD